MKHRIMLKMNNMGIKSINQYKYEKKLIFKK